MGRIENADPSDCLVLTRKLNHPELIFNNSNHQSTYFQQDSDMQWRVSYNGQFTHECYLCQKYKYTCIFLDKDGPNSNLVEIRDENIIKKVKENLNIEKTTDFRTPIICGTVTENGFQCKLKMMKCELFSLLSASESDRLFDSWTQVKETLRGIMYICKTIHNIIP